MTCQTHSSSTNEPCASMQGTTLASESGQQWQMSGGTTRSQSQGSDPGNDREAHSGAQPSTSHTCAATSQVSMPPSDSNAAAGQNTCTNAAAPGSSNDRDSPSAKPGSAEKPTPAFKATRQSSRGGPCVECGATRSVLFRKSLEGAPLCNACGLRYQRRLGKQHSKGGSGNYALAAVAGEASTPPDRAKSAPSVAAHASPGSVGGKRARAKGSNDIKPSTARRKLPVEGQKCVYCGTTQSPQWRYVGSNLACNACALQRKRRAQRTNSDPKVCIQPTVFM